MSVLLTFHAQVHARPEIVWEHLVDEVWTLGRGFPAKPTIIDAGDEHGIGCTRRFTTLPGTQLIERIEKGGKPSWFTYRVVNPGWRTFPVRWHRGSVTLTETNHDHTEVEWHVEFDPLPGARPFATLFTRRVISGYLTYLRTSLNT